MLKQIRHIQKTTLIIVTAIIVVAFAFFYSNYDTRGGNLKLQSCVVKVYDRCYRQKEAQKFATFFDVALALGMYDFAVPLMSGSQSQKRDPADFVTNLIILRRQAENLGIEPGAEEIKKAIPKLPVFQQPQVDAAYIKNKILGPNGFNDGDFAQLVKDYLSYQKIRDLVGSAVQAIPSEVEKTYIKENQRFNALAIHFDRKNYIEKVKVSDAEIKTYYEENRAKKGPPVSPPAESANPDGKAPLSKALSDPKQTLLSEEKRGFNYVKFIPAPDPKDASREVISKRKLAFANAVNRIYADLSEEGANFTAVAKRYQSDKTAPAGMKIELGNFAPFTSDGAPDSIRKDEAQVSSLFSATVQKGAVTVPYQQKDGSYNIYQFSEQIAPQPLSLKEATPAIITVLKNKKSNQLVSEAANAARARLNDLLKAGKTFQEAAKETGIKPEKIPSFSESEPPAGIPDASLILSAVQGSAAKSLSRVVEKPEGRGFLMVYVEKIELYKDKEKDSHLRTLTASSEMELKRDIFSAWLKNCRVQAGADRNESVGPLNQRAGT